MIRRTASGRPCPWDDKDYPQPISATDVLAYIDAHGANTKTWAVRGDNFIPVKHFKRSRYHGDDADHPIQVDGVSAVELSDIYGKWEDDRLDYLQRQIEIAFGYGDHVFLLSGEVNRAETESANDSYEVVLKAHAIELQIV